MGAGAAVGRRPDVHEANAPPVCSPRRAHPYQLTHEPKELANEERLGRLVIGRSQQRATVYE